MYKNKLKEKVKNREKLIGMYVQLTDISISRMAGLAGYDFVWVDTEHSFMSHETLLAHVISLRSTGTPVIVRLPQNDFSAAKHVLEMGVDGIIFPMVRNAGEANALVAATLYPPEGNRGFGPMNAIDYGFKKPFEYTKESNEELCRFIQIEHRDAIDGLDEIMKNPYIDGYIFGANDLSGSYNMLGDIFSEKITSVIKETIDRLHANGKYAGIAAGGNTEEILGHWSSLGAEMLAAGADFDFIRDGLIRNRKLLEKVHKNA